MIHVERVALVVVVVALALAQVWEPAPPCPALVLAWVLAWVQVRVMCQAHGHKDAPWPHDVTGRLPACRLRVTVPLPSCPLLLLLVLRLLRSPLGTGSSRQ